MQHNLLRNAVDACAFARIKYKCMHYFFHLAIRGRNKFLWQK
jgi:hypothetical protein